MSAWIDGGIIKSAPRQKPVRHEIIMKARISPWSINKTNEKKKAAEINDIDQVFFLLKNLLNFVQKGIPIKADKK